MNLTVDHVANMNLVSNCRIVFISKRGQLEPFVHFTNFRSRIFIIGSKRVMNLHIMTVKENLRFVSTSKTDRSAIAGLYCYPTDSLSFAADPNLSFERDPHQVGLICFNPALI